jgi:hypothetical protein
MLTVSGPSKYRGKQGSRLWLCSCDCGRQKHANATWLKDGRLISCGCFRRGDRSARVTDIAGKVFGRLTAIRPDESHKRHWICKCECGNECSVRGTALRDLHTKSCGCLRSAKGTRRTRRSLIGGVFGRLTVTGGPHGKGNQRKWLCRCSCGKTKWIVGRSLVGNNTKSCGCGQFAPLNPRRDRSMVGFRRIEEKMNELAD